MSEDREVDWTGISCRIAALREKLRQAENDRDEFRWTGLRMQAVLERIKKDISEGRVLDVSWEMMAVKAIDIVCGREADWGGEFRKAGWFGPVEDEK